MAPGSTVLKKTAQAGRGGGGTLAPQMAPSCLWASTDQSIGLVDPSQSSKIQAERRPGVAMCHPQLPHPPLKPGATTPPPLTDPAMWGWGAGVFPGPASLARHPQPHHPHSSQGSSLGRGPSWARCCSHYSSLAPCKASSPSPKFLPPHPTLCTRPPRPGP